MTDQNKYTASCVVHAVDSITCRCTKPGDTQHPDANFLEDLKLPPSAVNDAIWSIYVGVRVGLDRNTMHVHVFTSEAEADEFMKKHTVGTVLEQNEELYPIDFSSVVQDSFDKAPQLLSSDGELEFGKIYQCLEGAGVYETGQLSTSKAVLNWAGEDRIAWAKQRDPENWSVIVEMEYCTHHFPRKSLAYMAAQCHFNFYITQDDFSAGYLMREIELVLGGAEQVAEGVLRTRETAGKAGRQASQAAKNKRLNLFLEEIEKLADSVGSFPEHVILNQAFKNAVAADEKLWRQGRGQQQEYETILRSEPLFRLRYFAVIGKTA